MTLLLSISAKVGSNIDLTSWMVVRRGIIIYSAMDVFSHNGSRFLVEPWSPLPSAMDVVAGPMSRPEAEELAKGMNMAVAILES